MRRFPPRKRLLGAELVGREPASKLFHQILELDLPLQVTLDVLGGSLQQCSAPRVRHGLVRPPRLDDDLLAMLDTALDIRLEQQLGKYGGRQIALQAEPERLGHTAQNQPHAGRLRSLQEPAERVHRREVEAGDGGEVQHQGGRRRRAAQGFLETIGQGDCAAEEDVATQPVDVHALTLRQQDGALGHGTDLVAPALAGGEPVFNGVHAAEPDREEHERGQHAGGHPLEQPEGNDDREDQENDGELGGWKPPAAPHEAFVQHAEAGKDENPSHDRRRDELQHAVAKEQRASDDDGRDHTGQPGGGPEELAAQRGRDDQGRHRAAAQTANHAGNPRGPELPVPVQLLVDGKLEAGHVHDDAEESDQHEDQHVGHLAGHRRPVHMSHIGRPQDRPQAPVGRAREQQARRSRLFSGKAQGGKSQVMGADGQRDTGRQDQRIAQALHHEVERDPEPRSGGPYP